MVGDWDGNGSTDIGVYIADPADGDNWVLAPLRSSNGNKLAEWRPNFGGGVGEAGIVGDWDGDGRYDVGVYRPLF